MKTALFIRCVLAGTSIALARAGAHEALAEYVWHRVELSVNARHIDVSVELTFFETWSSRERQRMDTNHDARIQRREADVYAGCATEFGTDDGRNGAALANLLCERFQSRASERSDHGGTHAAPVLEQSPRALAKAIPALITVHPSALLRLPEGLDPEIEFQRFVDDLRGIERRNTLRPESA